METKTKVSDISAFLPDDRIIALFFSRDEKAISETDKKYGNYLFAVAYNILHDESDSAECKNDTFLGAWNNIPPTRPQALAAYLAKITRRLAINLWRKNRREKRIPPEQMEELSDFEGFLHEQSDISNELDSKIIAAIISEYLRSVSERRRYIFMSRYYYIRPIAAIADVLNVSISTVKKDLFAMKQELRDRLESEGIEV